MGRPLVLVNRRSVLVGLAFGSQSRMEAAASYTPHILFVCPAGTVKSAIAREMTRHRARELGISLDVRSRGVIPEDHVSPGLAARLRVDGIDLSAQPLLALSAEDIAWADRIIVFDSALQAPGMSKAEPWEIPSWNDAYDSAKAALIPRINALLKDVHAQDGSRPKSN